MALLDELLETARAKLVMEIRHTDHRVFRDELRHRLATLEGLIERSRTSPEQAATKTTGNLTVRSPMRAPLVSTVVLFPVRHRQAPLARVEIHRAAGDRATLESDLSAMPEAEMGWGVRNAPSVRFADVSLISARKR